MSKKMVKILMENYLPREKYEEKIKRKINLYLGSPICNGQNYDMGCELELKNIFQEVYHKQSSTILLEEEVLNSSQENTRAAILITYDEGFPKALIENLKNISPYLKLEEDIEKEKKKRAENNSQWFG